MATLLNQSLHLTPMVLDRIRHRIYGARAALLSDEVPCVQIMGFRFMVRVSPEKVLTFQEKKE